MGPNLDDLADKIANALKGVFSQALDATWTSAWATVTKSLPALLVQSAFGFIGSLATWIYDGLQTVFRQWNIVTQTPPQLTILGLSAVRTVFDALTVVAFLSLAVVMVLIGFGIMSRIALGNSFPELLEILPRLVIGVLWIVTTPLWFGWALEVTNRICATITQGAPFPGWGSASVTLDAAQQTTAQSIAVLVYAVAGMFLFIQSLIRIAVINFAVVLAPFALLCWVLPQWYWLYSIWLRVLVAAFVTQLLQALAVGLGVALLNSFVGPLGTEGPAAPLLTAAMGVATVLAAWSLPRQVVGSYGPGLALPRMLLAGVAAGAAVAKGVSSVGGAASAGAVGAAGAAAGVSSIVPLPPPPVGAPTPSLSAAASVATFPSIPNFPS